jgi:hypothetical protein
MWERPGRRASPITCASSAMFPRTLATNLESRDEQVGRKLHVAERGYPRPGSPRYIT